MKMNLDLCCIELLPLTILKYEIITYFYQENSQNSHAAYSFFKSWNGSTHTFALTSLVYTSRLRRTKRCC